MLEFENNWWPLQDGDKKSASLTCPECKHKSFLVDHDIRDDGTVSPSVICATDGCIFHEFIKLKDWA